MANSLLVATNILLVIVTTAYVWLTWQTLKALQKTSLREREARHLEDIKSAVIQPIVMWIAETVVGRFTGREPPLLVPASENENARRQLVHQVDDPLTARHRLVMARENPKLPDSIATWESTDPGRISKFLFDHAKRNHFAQLHLFDRLLRDVAELTGAIVDFANECANHLTHSKIPSATTANAEKSMTEWSNPHLIAAECIHAFLRGEQAPQLYDQDSLRSDGTFMSLANTHGQTVALARKSEELRKWRDSAVATMRERWTTSGLPERVNNLLHAAGSVRSQIDQLNFTQSLATDCDLVS